MGDPNFDRITAALEEFNSKKQLPLRQSAQKPLLKQYAHLTKQVLNQSDIVHIRPDNGGRVASGNGPGPSGSSIASSPYRLSKANFTTTDNSTSAPVTHTLGSYLGGQTYIAPSNIGKPNSANPVKTHPNPYTRPLSAKDIVSDLQQQQQQRYVRKTSNTSQVSPVPGLLARNETPISFPVNAFMRPQSAIKKNSVAPNGNGSKDTEKESFSKVVVKTESSAPGHGWQDTSDKKLNDCTHAYVNQKIPGASTIITTTSTSQNSQGGQVSTTSVTTSRHGATIIQKVSPPANFGSQINTIISKVTDHNKPSQTKAVASTGNTPAKTTMSSIPKPGPSPIHSSSSSSGSNSKPSSADLPNKIRNLNYTPTKPYSEVMDPMAVSKTLSENDSKPAMHSNPSKPLQTSATVISYSENQAEKPPSSASIKSETSKSSSASSSSTLYYSKASKSEVILHEQRPPVVGAPSKTRPLSEKTARNEDDEEEGDEESETSTPGERFPGDGEASIADDDENDDEDGFGEDDDDGIDCLDDDCVGGGSDGESDGYSITSSLSRQSSAKSRARSARRPASRSVSTSTEDSTRPRTAKTSFSASDVTIKLPLDKSLFPNIPPTIHFVLEGEKVEQLPWDLRKLLKWRMSPITPNIVKSTLARTGFRITKRSHDWLGCWGKHMKSQGFKGIREYQKLNHFPGSFNIGRKDKLWRNLSKMQVHFGKKEFGFFPQTFVLPSDHKLCKRAFEDGGTKQKWIVKPPASARGIGIKVISKWAQIPRKRAVIVQRYLSRPYLINDSKFDLRIYVYVSCYDPLRIYMFEDGLARFASCKYSSSMKNLNNKFMHLTNYSINKKNDEYQANGDEKVCQGHKWGLKALWSYMKRQGVNTSAVWENIKDLVIKTIVCSESPINSMIKANCKSKYSVHELFGFDVMLDENLKPWILEVNISPSLHSNSQLDINIKGQMIRDLFNIAGFRIPDKADVAHSTSTSPNLNEFSLCVPPNDYCMDKRLFTAMLSGDERSKHAYYSQRYQDEQLMQTILDILTPDDVRILTESIDEDNRKGCFQRVFPSPNTHKYLQYFETTRYYNLLLDQWVQRYNRMEQKGINLLQMFCEDGVHLENPTGNPYHQWNAPSGGLNSYRGDLRMQSAPQPKHETPRAGTTLKTSISSSQLPKVSKKPPKPPSVLRTPSQASSTSTGFSGLTESSTTTIVPAFSKGVNSSTKTR